MSPDDTIHHCERVFAKDLDGHRILSNNSQWRRFPAIWNERWSFGNVVLLGDALRTAHFSIGSGTRLAMEDAIALFKAFGRSDQAFEKSFVVHVARFRRHIHDIFRLFGSRDARFGSGSHTFRCC